MPPMSQLARAECGIWGLVPNQHLGQLPHPPLTPAPNTLQPASHPTLPGMAGTGPLAQVTLGEARFLQPPWKLCTETHGSQAWEKKSSLRKGLGF